MSSVLQPSSKWSASARYFMSVNFFLQLFFLYHFIVLNLILQENFLSLIDHLPIFSFFLCKNDRAFKNLGFHGDSDGKEYMLAIQETWVQSLGWEDPPEKEMATPSNILAWRIPWMEEPGRLQFMGSQRVGHY